MIEWRESFFSLLTPKQHSLLWWELEVTTQKMNKTQFLEYFKKKTLSSNDHTEITVTKVVNSATKNISNNELSLVEDKIEKSIKRPSKYEKTVLKLLVLELLQQLRSLFQSIANSPSTQQL